MLRSRRRRYSLIGLFIIITLAVAFFFVNYFVLTTPNPVDFTILDVNGNNFSLSDHRGEIVLIEFMSTNCNACEMQVPEMSEVLKVYREKLFVISIGVKSSDSNNALKDFMKKHNTTWTHAKDTINLSGDYNLTELPTFFIIDNKGYIYFRIERYTPASTLLAHILEVLLSQ